MGADTTLLCKPGFDQCFTSACYEKHCRLAYQLSLPSPRPLSRAGPWCTKRPDDCRESLWIAMQAGACCCCCCRGGALVLDRANHLLAPSKATLTEGEVHIYENSKNAADLTHAAGPQQSSASKMEKHSVDELHCTSCRQYVMAARLGRRRKSSLTVSSVPIVGMDNFCITKQGIKRHEELTAVLGEEGDEVAAAARTTGMIVRCPLVCCFGTKHFISNHVPQEGHDEEQFSEMLEGLTSNGSATRELSSRPSRGGSLSAWRYAWRSIFGSTKPSRMCRCRAHGVQHPVQRWL